MAGLGRKVFAAGDVLSAADVDGYLMDQTVQTFATSAARSSAVGTAVSEGMVAYLKATDTNDTANQLDFYNGSAWESVRGYDVAGKNKIINGGFDIWQRGAGPFTTTNVYNADRFFFGQDGGSYSLTRSSFTPGSAPISGYESQYYATVALTASGGAAQFFGHRVEDVRTFAGQTVTLSFWAKASTSTSSTPLAIQNFGSGGSSVVVTTLATQTIGTSWTRFSQTFTFPSITGKTIGTSNYLELHITRTTTNATLDIWGVQLEAGSVATPFSRAGGTIQGELAACQRYYIRYAGGQNYSGYGMGWTASTTRADILFQLPVQMRVIPTSTDYSNVNLTDSNYGNYTLSALSIDAGYSGPLNVNLVATTTGLTANRPARLQNSLNTSGYIGLSAEL